ncbi:MAG: T9SS type A sorting domain-containing protein [Bacteroidaceae bacterium]
MTFSDDVLMYATLYVPVGAKAAYEAVEPWQNFRNIVEIEYEDEDATGIAAVPDSDGGISVRAEGGVLLISGAPDLATVTVYSAGGQLVYQGTDVRIGHLPGGVYIVRVGNVAKKVAL